jgi:hypothetical protein
VITQINDLAAHARALCRRRAQHVILRASSAHDRSARRTRAHGATPRAPASSAPPTREAPDRRLAQRLKIKAEQLP